MAKNDDINNESSDEQLIPNVTSQARNDVKDLISSFFNCQIADARPIIERDYSQTIAIPFAAERTPQAIKAFEQLRQRVSDELDQDQMLDDTLYLDGLCLALSDQSKHDRSVEQVGLNISPKDAPKFAPLIRQFRLPADTLRRARISVFKNTSTGKTIMFLHERQVGVQMTHGKFFLTPDDLE